MGNLMKIAKSAASLILIVGLVFSSGLLSIILYGKMSGKPWALRQPEMTVAFAEKAPPTVPTAVPTPKPAVSLKASAMLKAPLIRQYPELPSGCELTSLAMLLQYAGIRKDKMELVPELAKDPTKLRLAADGTIAFWGDPRKGFVGDITGKAKGFGVFHSGLYGLLAKYIPSAVDLTGVSFDKVLLQVSAGIPAVVWTTVDYAAPSQWVTWDTPNGPVRTTFSEHAVLLVGYDERYVYVNDPLSLSGQSASAVDKEQFIKTWQTMGSQALSYKEPAR